MARRLTLTVRQREALEMVRGNTDLRSLIADHIEGMAQELDFDQHHSLGDLREKLSTAHALLNDFGELWLSDVEKLAVTVTGAMLPRDSPKPDKG